MSTRLVVTGAEQLSVKPGDHVAVSQQLSVTSAQLDITGANLSSTKALAQHILPDTPSLTSTTTLLLSQEEAVVQVKSVAPVARTPD